MNTLKKTLISNASAIIMALVSVTLLLVAVYGTVLRQERAFGDVILLEQGITGRASDVVRAYNEYRNAATADRYEGYLRARNLLSDDTEDIGAMMVPSPDRVAYDGVLNSVRALIKVTDDGAAAVAASDVTASTAAYEKAIRMHELLPDAVSRLLSEELMLTRDARAQIQHRQTLVVSVSMVVLVVVILFAVSVALRLARRVSAPLEELVRLSHEIAAGRYDVTFAPSLSEGKDEIAALSNAFELMADNLKSTVEGLKRSNDELVSIRDQMAQRNDMLEKLNNLFITREQRIKELKNLLRLAGHPVSDASVDVVDSAQKGV